MRQHLIRRDKLATFPRWGRLKTRVSVPRYLRLLLTGELSPQATEGEITQSNGGRPMAAPTERRELRTHRRAGARSRRPVREQTKPSPVGKVARLAVTDEGLQAVGTAMRNVLLTSVPHQALRSGCFPIGKTPRDAARLGQLTPLHRGAENANHVALDTMVAPTERRELCTHRHAPSVSRRAFFRLRQKKAQILQIQIQKNAKCNALLTAC